MKTVGWGIIGCSDIVKGRAGDAIAQQKNSRLVAFLSRSRDRAAFFAERFGAERIYDDLESFLSDDRIHVVYVATEPERHNKFAVAAINRGKHVLVEKPMALTPKECYEMIERSEQADVILSVAYYARFFEKAKIMKRVIREGHLGKVVRANVQVMGYYNPPPSDPKYWRVTDKGGGNKLADVGSHRLDMLTYFLGRPTKVTGFVDRLSHDYEAADTETAVVQYEGGVHVTVLANANVPERDKDSSMEIYGTEGSLLTDPWLDEPVEVIGNGNGLDPIEVHPPSNAHAPMIDDFARAVAENRAPRFSGIDGMWATEVIYNTYESARTGKQISIADYDGGKNQT